MNQEAMIAFVQNAGLGATRVQLPYTGLQHVCATTARPTPCETTSSRSAVQMALSPATPPDSAVNYKITLDTLLYHPDPAISGVEDKDLVCHRVWTQVFGNAYVMESERADAYKAESMYRAGQIPLKEFVRGVALSSTYRRRFFECCGTYRAVELNFKHLLGRGPNTKEEASEHVQRLINEGFEAEINSYIDSLEYDEAFGNDKVPYSRFKGTYPTLAEFTRMCAINSSPGTTDKSLTIRARNLGIENPNTVLSLSGAGIPPKIVHGDPANYITEVAIEDGLPSRPDLEFGQSSTDTPVINVPPIPVINENSQVRRRVEISMNNYMYLTEEEEAEYNAAVRDEVRIVSLAETEILAAKTQIASLQMKVDELSLIV